ncbi:hydroxypyruvate isomerase family protein [Actinomycetospora sp. CA-084318]|uniref:hydroxypyruvate isomerase family protein n=1 Tax=Actinomycetospora sp. CA-084318 TaxID=3239892 RepID=UPI003D996266
MNHPLPYAANCSILFTELPLLARPAAARAAGFDAVEFWWPFATAAPADADVEAFAAAVLDAGVRLTALNLAAGDMAGGDRGLISRPGREAEVADSIDIAADLGKRLGTTAFNALYGLRLDGADPQEQDELAVVNLRRAATRLDGDVVLEPLSGVAAYPLRTAADALAVADRVGEPSVRLLADLYHLAVNGEDLAAVIERHADRIGHVQIADAPGRHEPGTGSLPIAEHLAALARAGYGGHVGLEYVPSTTTAASFGWMQEQS